MHISRESKEEMVARYVDLLKNSQGIVITHNHGMTMTHFNEVRAKMREIDSTYLVTKNTLLRLAAKNAGKDGLDEYLNGPTAIAFAADDPSVAAKVLHESFKTRELPRVKVFVVEDEHHSADALNRLADLPSKEILLAQLAAAVESPLSALVRSLNAVFQDLVGTVDALAEKKKSES